MMSQTLTAECWSTVSTKCVFAMNWQPMICTVLQSSLVMNALLLKQLHFLRSLWVPNVDVPEQSVTQQDGTEKGTEGQSFHPPSRVLRLPELVYHQLVIYLPDFHTPVQRTRPYCLTTAQLH